MRVLLDTSVFVAAMVESHPAHERALPWLQQIHAHTLDGFVAAHSLAEIYAVLTRLPIQPRITPQIAHEMVTHNITTICTIVALSAADYTSLLTGLAQTGLVGGIVYDAIILSAARQAGVDKVVSLNARDFRRIAPDPPDWIIEP
ncbi:MAG: PIN domain-containing protein [Roseiflexaceae bacterium]|nr:PIN domain-containing protein [Roseiflexaceae bacterium]